MMNSATVLALSGFTLGALTDAPRAPADSKLSALAAFLVVLGFVAFFVFALVRARRRRKAELSEGPIRLAPALPPEEPPKPIALTRDSDSDSDSDAAPELSADGAALRLSASESLARPEPGTVRSTTEASRVLRRGLAKTQEGLLGRLSGLFSGKAIPPALLSQVEEILLTSDVGVRTTEKLIAALKERLQRHELQDLPTLLRALEKDVDAALRNANSKGFILPQETPAVVLFVGVNGVGKTTTIGKLANRFQREGKRVLVAAGDTFRAAAAEQLHIWAERSGAGYFAGKPQQDPASVLFEAVSKGKAEGYDIVLCDTAGRLHTKAGLMDELKKVQRVVQKVIPSAPHQVLLVVDGTTGQNAVTQAREFNEAFGLTGIVLTKLDGTAKGGVIVAIAAELQIPIHFVGVGEGVDDLEPFAPEEFAAALFR